MDGSPSAQAPLPLSRARPPGRSTVSLPSGLAQEILVRPSSVFRPLTGATILRDGVAAFPRMIEMIGNARRVVRFDNFIFAGDATGRRYAKARAAAASAASTFAGSTNKSAR